MSYRTPNPALDQLDVLVGLWDVTVGDGPQGAADGQVSFDWLEGGHFLVQRVDLGQARGYEYIGYDEETATLRSHLFGESGDLLRYTWEVTDEAVTIWYGEPGSDNRFEGRFSTDRNTLSGGWTWPGGGYRATMTRSLDWR